MRAILVFLLLVVDLFFFQFSFNALPVALFNILLSLGMTKALATISKGEPFFSKFLFFLSFYLFLFYGLRVIWLKALFFIAILLLIGLALKKENARYYYLLAFGLVLLGQVVALQIKSQGGFLIAIAYLLAIGVLFSVRILHPVAALNGGLIFQLAFWLNFFLAVTLLDVSHGPRKKEIKQILSQKEVASVLLYRQHKKELKGGLIRYVFDSCDGKQLFLVMEPGSHTGLWRLDVRTHRLEPFFRGKVLGDAFAQDCIRKQLYFDLPTPDGKQRKVFVVSEHNLQKPLSTYLMSGGRRITYYSLDPTRDRAYYLQDWSLVVTRLSDGKVIKKLDRYGGVSPALASNGDLLFLSQTCSSTFQLFASSICRLSFKNGLISEVAWAPREGKMIVDQKSDQAFLTDPFGGFVLFVDLATGKVKRKIYLEPFVRRLAFDPKTRLLVVAGYFQGNLYFIDVDSAKIEKKIYVGRRAHGVYFSKGKPGVYIATTQGVFHVGLPEKN